ncbi:MAG TPA: S46 family peptidase [Planctomycetaceae bacterium]|nr:S46 family peptidase [Planctomycetaceae bacterium]HQZ64362.1 S46 family peptidase [Planctomycetaceae bacterium]
MLRSRLVLPLLSCILINTSDSSRADEGMWLFNDLPQELLKQKYGFEPTPEWADHLMKSCVRFNVGGSASFISSSGLVLTNHHVGSDTLYKLSTPERNILDVGFLAKTHADELKAPDLELNQLVNIKDVTAEVKGSVTADMTTEQAVAARRAIIAKIEKSELDETGLKSSVTTLYGGGRYHLYQYKKYTDVRLVWAPETAIAFFGGDADNFEYPRYCLDACIFRVYENDEPAKIEHFLAWSKDGPKENDVTFVSGNPGRTSRIHTMDAIKYQRDRYLPYVMDILRRQEILLQQYGLRGKEQARRAREDLFGVQNSRKARLGMLAGLQDPQVLEDKAAAEKSLVEAINADPKLKSLASAWQTISETTKKRAEILGTGVAVHSQLFGIALQLVQMAEEDQKPSGERLPQYADAGRESLLQQLYSEAPIYTDLEQVLLGDSIARTLEQRGFDVPLCQQILAGKSPADRAAELITGTELLSVENRKQVAAGGIEAIRQSTDPLIQLAKIIDPEVRRLREITDQLDEQDKQAYAKISEARFAIQGTSVYPDATFTLRLAFGPVRGYEQDGEMIPAWTSIGGAFEHEKAHAGQTDYSLPESWKKAETKLNKTTPLNFVSTADIIGGNSGSPVVNRAGELVGLIFDGNIQSLSGNYVYTDKQARCVSVHSSAIREALKVVYGADAIVKELEK